MAVPMKTLTLDGRSLDFDALRKILGEPVPGRSIRLKLSSSALKRVSKSRKTIDRALAAGKTIYGVNTGFGKLADTRVDAPAVEQLQKNLLLSHAAGLDFTLGRETAALVVVLEVFVVVVLGMPSLAIDFPFAFILLFTLVLLLGQGKYLPTVQLALFLVV